MKRESVFLKKGAADSLSAAHGVQVILVARKWRAAAAVLPGRA